MRRALTQLVAGVVGVVMVSACTLMSDPAVSDDEPATGGDPVTSDDSIASADTDLPCPDDRQWTPGADEGSEYVDFVQLERGHFLHAEHNAGVLENTALSAVVAEVCFELSEMTFDGPFDIQVGDAAYLPPGTKLREIDGADPSLRLGTVVDGRVLVYELWDPPDAVIGGQVIDFGQDIERITVNDVDDGSTVLASIDDRSAVESIVAAVREAPVDRTPRPEPAADGSDYVLEFHRGDGTSTRRRYRPVTGELAGDIIVPEEIRLQLIGLLAEVSATTTSTTTAPTSTTTTAATPSSSSGSTGPVSEAESDLRWDFGVIVDTAVEDGVTWLHFDRFQYDDPTGANGPSLTAEPGLAGASDLIWKNENPRLRWYQVAPGVEVLEVEPDRFEAVCANEPVDVEFMPSSLNRLLDANHRFVSLTFGGGEVVRIRDQSTC